MWKSKCCIAVATSPHQTIVVKKCNGCRSSQPSVKCISYRAFFGFNLTILLMLPICYHHITTKKLLPDFQKIISSYFLSRTYVRICVRVISANPCHTRLYGLQRLATRNNHLLICYLINKRLNNDLPSS